MDGNQTLVTQSKGQENQFFAYISRPVISRGYYKIVCREIVYKNANVLRPRLYIPTTK